MTEQQPRLLLLDGDVFCFVAAAAAQKDLRFEDGVVHRWADEEEAKGILDDLILKVCKKLGTNEYLFFLTDPEVNWRTQVYPEYKSNRSGGERPQLLTFLKDYSLRNHTAIRWAGMEADDLMGIYATGGISGYEEFSSVIVSKDKDMRTIPGWFYNMNRLNDPTYDGPEFISEEAADWWHLVQTLAGDAVDGYPGCPTIGVERAKAILNESLLLYPAEGYVTRGPRKGQRTVKWMSKPTDDLWKVVVSNYEKNGKTEEDALTMARVARICRAEDYDFQLNTVALWEPY